MTWLRSVIAGLWWSIVLFSSGGSAGGDWTRKLLHRLFGLEGHPLDVANLLLRKGGHVFYYGILTTLLAWALQGVKVRRSWVWGAILALLTGCLDETRQSLFSNRSGTAWDLLYDGVGIGVAALLLWRAAKE